MDDGHVIPGLNENWTFAGAKPMEWASGLVAALIVNELFLANLGKSMPIFIMICVLVPMTLATLRKTYPDEERGVANHLMSFMGLQPPGIPAPSMLQVIWSGTPMRQMNKEKQFMKLGLDLILFEERYREFEQDIPDGYPQHMM